MTRTPFELAREAKLIDQIARETLREAQRAELREAMARATVRLYALADQLDSDAADLASGTEIIL